MIGDFHSGMSLLIEEQEREVFVCEQLGNSDMLAFAQRSLKEIKQAVKIATQAYERNVIEHGPLFVVEQIRTHDEGMNTYLANIADAIEAEDFSLLVLS